MTTTWDAISRTEFDYVEKRQLCISLENIVPENIVDNWEGLCAKESML
jgi:hypothetical protein